jgi:hypothetical protein
MTREEMDESIEEKKRVLKWMEENEVNSVDSVGKVIAEYYSDREKVVDAVEKDSDPDVLKE